LENNKIKNLFENKITFIPPEGNDGPKPPG
jgi:hypothetical protein